MQTTEQSTSNEMSPAADDAEQIGERTGYLAALVTALGSGPTQISSLSLLNTHLQSVQTTVVTLVPETLPLFAALTSMRRLSTTSQAELKLLSGLLKDMPQLEELSFNLITIELSAIPWPQLRNLRKLVLGQVSLDGELEMVLPQLNHLDIQECFGVLALPLYRFPALHTIVWVQNDYTPAVGELCQTLPHLISLYLEIDGATPNALAELVDCTTGLQFESIVLSSSSIANVPPEVGRLNSLTELNLAFNHVSSLPAEIGQLGRLKVLNLWSNHLTSLPDEIGELGNLRRLGLANNRLISLPPSVARLTRLKSLDIGINLFRTLPEEICQLTTLTRLTLFRNRLTELPSAFSALVRLENLDILSNSLASFPPCLAKLPSLRELLMPCVDLPPSIGQLTQLRQLCMYNCMYNRLGREAIACGKQLRVPVELLKLELLTVLSAEHACYFQVPRGPRFRIPNFNCRKDATSALTPIHGFVALRKLLLCLGAALECDMPILEAVYRSWSWKREVATGFSLCL